MEPFVPAGADGALLAEQLRSLSEGVPERVTVLANAAALLYHTLPDLNWAGFYLAREDALWLGPFQGKPACVSIPYGKGVCGTAAAQRRTVTVPDVHAFSGHIACDGASNAEIVVPVFDGDALYGVLDVDSPVKNRFTQADRTALEAFVKTLEEILFR